MPLLPCALLRLPTALLAGALVATTPAWAGRPLQTDDAGVLAPAACELEGVGLRLAGDARTTEFALQLGCGVGFDSQIGLAVAHARTDGVGGSGVALVGKTAVWTAAPSAALPDALALAWGVIGARIGSDGWRHAGTEVALLYTRPVAAGWLAHANLGHARNALTRTGTTTWGVGIEYEGRDGGGRWVPVAEIFGDDRDRPSWNVGLRHAVAAERWQVDVSYGRQFSTARPSWLTIGTKFAF